MHFYAWKSGLKTGMYYLRSRPAVDAIKFTLNVEELLKASDSHNTDEILKVINKYEHTNDEKITKKESNTDVLINTNKYTKKEKEEEEEGCINCGS